MTNLIIELIDSSSFTALGVVLGLSFGLSIGITSFMAWLRPPRGVMHRPVQGVRRHAPGNGPQQTWAMTSLRPALRHVWRRQSENTVIVDRLPPESGFARLCDRIEIGLTKGQIVLAKHHSAATRIEATDYAIDQLRRDMAQIMPRALASKPYPAFARPFHPAPTGFSGAFPREAAAG